jgi:uncharacterized protein
MSLQRPGSFCWFELATTDQTAAKQFYQTLFDWDVLDSEMGPGMTYSMFKLGGRDVAATYTLRPEQQSMGVPAHWMLYVAVDDADATTALAEAHGGTVLAPPFEVADYGRMAVLKDPDGAAFSIWQPRAHWGVGVSKEPGSVGWADLNVPNQKPTADFYSTLFGWRMVADKELNEAAPGTYFHIANGDELIGGVTPPDQLDPHAPPHWMIYFTVADCKATTGKAASLGAQVHVDTMSIGENGTISVIADPQGAVFALHQGA